MKRDGFLWLAIALTWIVSLIPFGPLALYPLTIFETWTHEMGHGLTAMLLGGTFHKLTLAPDGSGLAFFSGIGPMRHVAVASMGYLGASIFGGILLALRGEKKPQWLLLAIAASLVVSLFWVRGLFGWVLVPVLAGLFFGASRLPEDAARFVLVFVAAQNCLNATQAIQTLFLVNGKSDAHTMAQLLLLPAPFWAVGWLGASAVIFWFGYRLGRR